MSAPQLAILLSILGVAMLVAELLLPTHGLLGVLGVCSIFVSIGVCFVINRWLGLGVFMAVLAASPLVGAAFVKYWPRMLVGRKLVLQPTSQQRPPLAAQIGQTGVTVSDLRPMGECEFDGQRMEAISEYGLIGAGQRVRVVSINDRRPVVRVV